MLNWVATSLKLAALLALAGCVPRLETELPAARQGVNLDSLGDLSVEALRARSYGSELKLEAQLGNTAGGTEYSDVYAETGSGPYETYLASYQSEGLRVYSRIDIPNTPAPEAGYPIIIFCHGWVGIDAAPNFHFSYTPASMYAELIDGYVDAGFVVLTPGYRGHGTVNGVPADGIEYIAAWDNATYLSPSFYAIDVLNLLEGIGSLADLDFSSFESRVNSPVAVDINRVLLSGHSQGGDVVLSVLAVAGEDSAVQTNIAAASISDGTFAPRLEQLEFYSAMQGTRRSFLAGDGTWTGSAVGADGSVNPEFVFGFPPQWIETPQPREWTWQAERWPDISVTTAIQARAEEMHSALTAQVGELRDLPLGSVEDARGNRVIRYDARIERGMEAIGGYNRPQYLSERLMLHYSDQDYYSPPRWNLELCTRVKDAGGECTAFLYENNSHLMRASEFEWFSPVGTKDSYRTILARDIRFFLGLDPADIGYQ